jgi:hypothetical protein
LGYFAKLADVPATVVDHVRGVLELSDTIVAETDAERTAKRHRQFVRERMGVKYEAARVREVAEQAIRAAVQTKDNPADLINVALEELVRARCELPGYTTLDAMAATVRAEVNGALFALVAARPERAERARLERMLVVDPATRRSESTGSRHPRRRRLSASSRTGWHTCRRWTRSGRPSCGWRDPAGQGRALRR